MMLIHFVQSVCGEVLRSKVIVVQVCKGLVFE